MQKFMCNVCGKVHDLYNDAALCHPDVVTKDFPEVPDRDAQLRIGADDAGHTCPSCEGRGMRAYHDTPGLWYCWACKGTGQV